MTFKSSQNSELKNASWEEISRAISLARKAMTWPIVFTTGAGHQVFVEYFPGNGFKLSYRLNDNTPFYSAEYTYLSNKTILNAFVSMEKDLLPDDDLPLFKHSVSYVNLTDEEYSLRSKFFILAIIGALFFLLSIITNIVLSVNYFIFPLIALGCTVSSFSYSRLFREKYSKRNHLIPGIEYNILGLGLVGFRVVIVFCSFLLFLITAVRSCVA
jgi:hypothetical protein